MTSTEKTPGEPKASSVDQKLMRHIARALYQSELPQPSAKMTRDERMSAWTAQRLEYIKRARKLYRKLENEGVAVKLVESAPV